MTENKKYIRQNDLAKKAKVSKQYINKILYKFNVEIILGEKIIIDDFKVESFLKDRNK